ncbi:hypothetical protein SISSUDRAFT_1128732 [Sistotremastrum suecicum HHB10207 ss-3]|uniref:DUF6533 domain-containing protein n=1 Tax=Sistotremastrum suecicum HHB10207 ss-3 TaxID=1314776 RepID=A0A166DIA3_9AGAM|nr:hypothetical protein SISSUDRAFT_1128732 [Sistotremastrum suecicum HHB10207 ss-3]
MLTTLETSSLISRDQYAFYGWISACSWLVWDFIISFDDEIVYIWRWSSLRNWCNVLYIYERYIVLLMMLSMGPIWNGWTFASTTSLTDTWCRGIGIYQSIIALVSILGTDIILVLRVNALYRCYSGACQNILRFLRVAFVAQFLASIVTVSIVTHSRKYSRILVLDDPPSYTCISVEISDLRSGNWIPSILFETMLVLMTLYQSLKHEFPKKQGQLFRLSILVDGLTVYILLLVTSIVCEVAWSRGKEDWIAVFYPWNIAAISFSGSRLILNMRKVSHGKTGSGVELTTIGEIVFHQRTPPDDVESSLTP